MVVFTMWIWNMAKHGLPTPYNFALCVLLITLAAKG